MEKPLFVEDPVGLQEANCWVKNTIDSVGEKH